MRTSEDFGTQGEKPTHPELLDWLASEFMDQRLEHEADAPTDRDVGDVPAVLACAAGTRDARSGEHAAGAADRGCGCRPNWFATRRSAASGLLNPAIGGKSIRPPQPAGVAELGYASSVKWVESTGTDRYRRGLYIHFQRTTPYPLLINFDAPDSNVTCTRRARSNTPLQALNLLNDPVFFEAAQALAGACLNEAPGDLEHARLRLRAVPRPPSAARDGAAAQYFDRATAFRDDAKSSAAMLPVEWPARPRATRGLGSVSRVLLNLDEFITRE